MILLQLSSAQGPAGRVLSGGKKSAGLSDERSRQRKGIVDAT